MRDLSQKGHYVNSGRKMAVIRPILNYGSGGTAHIVHNTVAFNSADQNTAGMYTYDTTTYVYNNIFWGNHDGLSYELLFGGSATNSNVEYNDIENLPGGYSGTNIDDDPEFYDDDNDDYHIYSGPCINTGKDLTNLIEYSSTQQDLDGKCRPVPINQYDMGSYECQ